MNRSKGFNFMKINCLFSKLMLLSGANWFRKKPEERKSGMSYKSFICFVQLIFFRISSWKVKQL